MSEHIGETNGSLVSTIDSAVHRESLARRQVHAMAEKLILFRSPREVMGGETDTPNTPPFAKKRGEMEKRERREKHELPVGGMGQVGRGLATQTRRL